MSSLTRFVQAQRQRRLRSSFSLSKIKSLSLPSPDNDTDVPSSSVANRGHSPIMEDLECTICNEEFSEDRERQPRTLHCGHTFCTQCLKILFSSHKKKAFDKSSSCPICRASCLTVDLIKVPVSFTILNIVLEIKKQRMRKRMSLGKDTLQSIGYCTPHSSPKQFWCSTCSEWICGACVVLNHTNDKTCEIKTVEEMVNSQKSVHEDSLEKIKSSRENIAQSILNAVDICETSKSLLRYDIKSLRNRIKFASNEIKSFEIVQQKMKLTSSSMDEEWSAYSSLAEGVEQANDYTQLESASEKFQALSLNYLEKDFFVQFRPKTWTKNLLLECWLKHPTSKFFVEDFTLAKQIFKVTVHWPSLCIHSGIVQNIPLGSMVVDLTDIAKQDERSFFFDLCYASEINLQFNISINQDNEFLAKFTDFCLGRAEESSYKGSRCHLEIIKKTGAKIVWIDNQMKTDHREASDLAHEVIDIVKNSLDEIVIENEALESGRPEQQNLVIEGDPEVLEPLKEVYINDSCTETVNPELRTDQMRSHDDETAQTATVTSDELRCAETLETNMDYTEFSITSTDNSLSNDENPKIIVQSSTSPEGTVLACFNNDKRDFCSKFGILLNSASVENFNYIDIGSIIDGELDFLRDELEYENVNQLVISDCGYKLDTTHL